MGAQNINNRSIIALTLTTAILISTLAAALPAAGGTLQQQIDSVGSQIDSKKKEKTDVEKQVAELSNQFQDFAGQYQSAYGDLSKTETDISKNQRQLNSAVEQQSFYQDTLNKRTVFAYRYGRVYLLEVLMDTKNFRDLLVRLDFLSKISQRDAEILLATKKLKDEIEATRNQLEEQKGRQRELVNTIANKKDEMDRLLATQQQLLNSVQTDIGNLALDQQHLIEARKAEQARLAALTAAGRTSNSNSGDVRDNTRGGQNPSSTPLGMIFPVSQPYAHGYSNDWGNPRPGGNIHQGTDIFGARGAPLVATVAGVIGSSFGDSRLGGYRLWLNGDDGYNYYYAHLNGDVGVAFAPGIEPGARVSQGQVIAYMGDSGQAKGTGVHLHFGITEPGGEWINPYPYLKSTDWIRR